MNCSKNGHSWFAPHLSVTDDTSCTYTSPLNVAGLNCTIDSQAFHQCPLGSFLKFKDVIGNFVRFGKLGRKKQRITCILVKLEKTSMVIACS